MTPWLHRYIVFAGSDYYPRGGMLDFDSDHYRPQAAIDRARELADGDVRWSHVYDCHDRLIVAAFSRGKPEDLETLEEMR